MLHTYVVMRSCHKVICCQTYVMLGPGPGPFKDLLEMGGFGFRVLVRPCQWDLVYSLKAP